MFSTILRAVALAVASGNRAATPVAVLSWAAVSGRIRLKSWPFRLLARPEMMNFLWFCALVEIFGDKLPITPKRTWPPSLLTRIGSGATTAATQFVADGRSLWLGALLGAVIGAAQTFAGYSLRTGLNRVLPNPISGVVGDAMALACSIGAIARKKRRWIW